LPDPDERPQPPKREIDEEHRQFAVAGPKNFRAVPLAQLARDEQEKLCRKEG
jgi:hypothetical protein